MAEATIDRVDAAAFRIPAEQPESDGTYTWDHTVLVVAEAHAGGVRGLGYTYGDAAAAALIETKLAHVVRGCDAFDIGGCWERMVRSVRNLGRPGLCSMAIAAVDGSLWDLKARLLNLPLVKLLGAIREAVPVYGSGGFTSYSVSELQAQLSGWVAEGIRMVKMKVGSDPASDVPRVRAARQAIGPAADLFVDANGAYNRKQAAAMAAAFAGCAVTWFEEPVSSDDLEGLRLLRDSGPPGMEIAAGEYGYDPAYFRRMLEAGAVDVLQADATRCGGITGFLAVDALCQAYSMPLSAHTAPSLHAHACCAAQNARHVEYFHDHVRLERMFFDGFLEARGGALRPDLSRPGLGIEFKRADAARFAV